MSVQSNSVLSNKISQISVVNVVRHWIRGAHTLTHINFLAVPSSLKSMYTDPTSDVRICRLRNYIVLYLDFSPTLWHCSSLSASLEMLFLNQAVPALTMYVRSLCDSVTPPGPCPLVPFKLPIHRVVSIGIVVARVTYVARTTYGIAWCYPSFRWQCSLLISRHHWLIVAV